MAENGEKMAKKIVGVRRTDSVDGMAHGNNTECIVEYATPVDEDGGVANVFLEEALHRSDFRPRFVVYGLAEEVVLTEWIHRNQMSSNTHTHISQ